MWLGAATQHTGVGLSTLLEAGVNLVPPAVAILGIGVLTFGIRPRMVSVVIYTLLGWSLLIVIVGGIGAVDHWVLDTSVFHQMASAPAVAPHWEANGIMMAIGCTGALLGGLAFEATRPAGRMRTAVRFIVERHRSPRQAGESGTCSAEFRDHAWALASGRAPQDGPGPWHQSGASEML